MIRDLRLAFRSLLKAKGFAITVVHAVLFRSLPVADPARLVRLGDGDNCCVIGGIQGRFSIYSYPLYLHLRDRLPEFQQLAAFQGGTPWVGIHRGSLASPAQPFVDQYV